MCIQLSRLVSGYAFLILGLSVAPAGAANVYHYVDWTSANVSGGTASGVINVPGSVNPVFVNFAATFANGSPGNLFFAQTNGGTNYWNPTTPYIGSVVANAPPDSDILALVGGVNQIYTVTLSEAIKDPIMAILSLGQPSLPTSYNFDSPFDIVSQAAGYWGGGPNALQKLPGDVLLGNEGHGTVQFLGTFSTFSWVVPTPESWHGFTFGIRTTRAVEPDPTPVIPLPMAAWSGLSVLGGLGLLKLRRGGRLTA
jgi:hypothetical protein